MPNLFELTKVSDSVSYMRRSDSGEIACVYAGFSNKGTAKRWAEWLAVSHSVASKFEIRTAKRLTSFKYEIKLWSMSLKSIERLATCDLSKFPPGSYGDAPKRELPKVPSHIELDNFQPGDVVRSTTVRNWTFTILEVRNDGFLETERIGVNPPIRSTLSPASVELIRRGGVVEIAAQEVEAELEKQAQNAIDSIQPPLQKPVSIDTTDVPEGVTLTRVSDDLLTIYDVWLWAEVRVFGKPQTQNKQLGRLTQTMAGIEATTPRGTGSRTFTRTLDAVKFLISCSGLTPVPKPVPVKSKPALVGATAAVDDDEF